MPSGDELSQRTYGNPRTYQIHHDTRFPQSRIEIAAGVGEESLFPVEYAHVANVEANSLRQALEKTTDTGGILDDSQPWEPWEKKEGVEAFIAAPRDTGPGDVIVDPQGQPYRVAESGFREIDERQVVPISPEMERLLTEIEAGWPKPTNPELAALPRADAAPSYDEILDQAVERGKHRQQEPEKGMSR